MAREIQISAAPAKFLQMKNFLPKLDARMMLSVTLELCYEFVRSRVDFVRVYILHDQIFLQFLHGIRDLSGRTELVHIRILPELKA